MKYLPYENFYIVTTLKPDEVQERLGLNVTTLKPDEVQERWGQNVQAVWGFSFNNAFSQSYNTPFSGYVVNGTFEFTRNINYYNPFLPLIKGTTEACTNGSRVHVKMRLHLFVMIFICLWLGATGLFGIPIFIICLIHLNLATPALIPFGMFIFGSVVVTASFKYESGIAKGMLLEILGGRIEESLAV
ncbi:hypothetical protein ACFGVR_11715 [Mucilaginibacter sp. AW1-3]